jgi:hypothetical protein
MTFGLVDVVLPSRIPATEAGSDNEANERGMSITAEITKKDN